MGGSAGGQPAKPLGQLDGIQPCCQFEASQRSSQRSSVRSVRPRVSLSGWSSILQDLADLFATFNTHIIASKVVLDGVKQFERTVVAGWTSFGFPLFLFGSRLVLSHWPVPPQLQRVTKTTMEDGSGES